MAKRRFRLPGVHELSKEQESVRALPKEGQHLVVGGPGTGKSVVALLRARRHQRDGDDYLFLVFNHLLSRSNDQLFGEGLVGRTWDGWFRETFETLTGQEIPCREPKPKGYKEIDWPKVEAVIREMPDTETRESPFLVIDEGQDMPPQFYDALFDLHYRHFFVVADQNQQITEANSKRRELEICLDIDSDKVIELKQNHRNSYRVAKLAKAFYTSDPAIPPPDLPAAEPGMVSILYRYAEGELAKVALGILRLSDRDPRRLIGVIAPNNRVRERYLQELHATQATLDNPRPAIETYHQDQRAEVAFDEGGILVINAQACKGLEFDTVVLADIDEHIVWRQDLDAARRLFYVMVARARKRVFMFMKKGGRDFVEDILPRDREILLEKEL